VEGVAAGLSVRAQRCQSHYFSATPCRMFTNCSLPMSVLVVSTNSWCSVPLYQLLAVSMNIWRIACRCISRIWSLQTIAVVFHYGIYKQTDVVACRCISWVYDGIKTAQRYTEIQNSRMELNFALEFVTALCLSHKNCESNPKKEYVWVSWEKYRFR
jgi:hypothetical protein